MGTGGRSSVRRAARTTVGFQFQSVGAVGPFLVTDLGLSYAELGSLMGLYLLPGVVLALPAAMGRSHSSLTVPRSC
jgi:hypothetical protein